MENINIDGLFDDPNEDLLTVMKLEVLTEVERLVSLIKENIKYKEERDYINNYNLVMKYLVSVNDINLMIKNGVDENEIATAMKSLLDASTAVERNEVGTLREIYERNLTEKEKLIEHISDDIDSDNTEAFDF